MARNRLNPWPAVADLFSALTVVTFAALIAMTLGSVILTQNETIERDATHALATIFTEKYRAKSGQSVGVGACTDRMEEQCIEIAFRFKPDDSELAPAGIEQVGQACQIYKQAVDEVVADMGRRRLSFALPDLALIIEGNTDVTVPANITDRRDRFLYNWRLSSNRAATVLYEFSECGVSPGNGYHIRSVGLADTNRVCDDLKQPSTDCHEQNRRTTMRIRIERNSGSANGRG